MRSVIEFQRIAQFEEATKHLCHVLSGGAVLGPTQYLIRDGECYTFAFAAQKTPMWLIGETKGSKRNGLRCRSGARFPYPVRHIPPSPIF